jgi:hypothetical protein
MLDMLGLDLDYVALPAVSGCGGIFVWSLGAKICGLFPLHLLVLIM